MKLFNDLLQDNIINKSELVIKRHEYLGLDAVQAAFVAKIFINNKDCYKDIDLKEASKLMDVDIETTNDIFKPLLEKGLLLFSINENNEPMFNFNVLIDKLLLSYVAPISSSSIESKQAWIQSKLTFELTDQMNEEIKKVISGMDWDILVEIINKSTEYKEQTFPLIMSLINSAPVNKQEKDEKVKEILEANWLK